MHTLLRNQ